MNHSRARRRTTLLLAAIVAVVAVPTIAIAGHNAFNDVPPGSTHANGIHYVAETGITQGCTPTQYCPTDPLTRAQMATFMHRSSGNDPATPPSVNAATIDAVQVVNGSSTVAGGSTANPQSIACPSGTRAVGGGGTAAIGWVLKDSRPSNDALGWQIQHRTFDNQPSPAGNHTAQIFAVCVPVGSS